MIDDDVMNMMRRRRRRRVGTVSFHRSGYEYLPYMLQLFGRIVLCLHVLTSRQAMECYDVLLVVLTCWCQLTCRTAVILEQQGTNHNKFLKYK
jgi:hypothetical protein